jgi:hypothetical protein
MDAVALVVRALSDDSSISEPVFGQSIPSDVAAPLVLVRSVTRRPSAAPSLAWWEHTLFIDVHSEDPSESHDLAMAVEQAVALLAGSHPEGVVANSTVDDTTFVEDGSWTPTRYRNVVTVSLTARD